MDANACLNLTGMTVEVSDVDETGITWRSHDEKAMVGAGEF
ncbi:hypothetical protein OH492_11710 [Vibrio chagasii]|nr:hypothetical protein [Vibrio chagasii]